MNMSDNVEKGIIYNFNMIVERWPERIALVYDNIAYTYNEIDKKTNRIAMALKKQGVKEGTTIVVYLPHSDSFVCAILAVLKCKCIYVPIDDGTPHQRVLNIMKKYQINTIICEEKRIEVAEVNQIAYDELLMENKQYDYVTSTCEGNKYAYIMFTSGSTGEPKGIPIRQKSILNLVYAYKKYLTFNIVNQQVRFLLFASFGFDMSTFQIYDSLLTGNTLDVLPIEKKDNMGAFLEYVTKHEIQVSDITPLFLDAIREYLDSNPKEYYSIPEYFISSGEALPLSVVQNVYKNPLFKDVTVLNSYGPTEACVYTSVYPLTSSNYQHLTSMLIGKPIENTNIYVVKDGNQICDIGEKGELYITGSGLADGYYNSEEKTKESFVYVPELFGEQIAYKTGDYGYYVESGDLFYSGRSGDQIKIRGYRVELGEIQYQIEKLDKVKKCIVLTQGKLKQKKIIAYFVAEEMLSVSYFREFLSQVLPAYMMPSYFVPVERFHFSERGKINKKELPDYKVYALREYVVSEKECIHDEILEKVINIAKDVLEIDGLQYNSNFFAAGGNSILLYSLNSKIQEEWGISLSIAGLLRVNTISGIADMVRNKGDESISSEDKRKIIGNIAPTTAFQRLLFSEEKKSLRMIRKYHLDEFPRYNVVYRILLDERIDSTRFRKVLDEVLNTIDSFHAVFVRQGNEMKMKKSKLEKEYYFEIQQCESIENLLEIKTYVKNFDITKTPLFQIVLLQDKKGRQCFLFNFHHAVFDYFSLHIFMQKLFKNYYCQETVDLAESNSFFEYTSRHITEDKTEQLSFWKKYYSNRSESVYIDGNIIESTHRMIEFREEEFYIQGKVYDNLRMVCQRTGASEYLFTFTVFAITICSMLHKEDIIIGTYINSRGQEKCNNLNTIGLITNLVGVRMKDFTHQKFSDYILKMQEEFIKVIENVAVDFNDVYEVFSKDDMEKGQLFHITYNYVVQGTFGIDDTEHEFKFQEIGEEPISIPFGLKGYQDDEKIIFRLKYCSQIYSEEFIKQFVWNYMHFITEFAQDDKLEIGQLNFEKHL